MRAISVIFLSLAAQPAAGDISLVLPIDCVLDQSCHIQQFVDHDPGEGASDFACGSLSYDGHKGTDFALPNIAAQAAGVDILAAADGIVRGVRNDMDDVLQGTPDAPDVAGRECGNGVVLAHADDFETQYCHLAKGSVTVRSGDTVAAGEVIGRVGLSGETQFPHLHLSLRQGDRVVDPFDPDGKITCGNPSDTTLWSTPLASPAGGIISGGWFNDVPTFDAIKAGNANRDVLSPNDPLVAWAYLFGTRAGDRLEVVLSGPDGQEDVLRDVIALDRTQAQSFRAFGKRAPDGGWREGQYQARVGHYRADALLDEVTMTVIVSP